MYFKQFKVTKAKKKFKEMKRGLIDKIVRQGEL